MMNWKKLLVAIGSSTAVGGLAPYVTSLSGGHPVAFTSGNVLVPALATLGSTLVALFTNPPHKDQP